MSDSSARYAHTMQHELEFIRNLGHWSPYGEPNSDTLIIGYVRGLRRRQVGFQGFSTLSIEQRRLLNEEVVRVCYSRGLSTALKFINGH